MGLLKQVNDLIDNPNYKSYMSLCVDYLTTGINLGEAKKMAGRIKCQLKIETAEFEKKSKETSQKLTVNDMKNLSTIHFKDKTMQLEEYEDKIIELGAIQDGLRFLLKAVDGALREKSQRDKVGEKVL